MIKQAPEECCVEYGDARIAYVLKKHTRGGSKVRVSVSPAGVVSVSASDSVAERTSFALLSSVVVVFSNNYKILSSRASM